MITLKPHKARFITFYETGSPQVPELSDRSNVDIGSLKPEYPLPLRRRDIKIALRTGDIYWFAGNGGVARYDENAGNDYDRVMFFSAKRDLQSGDVTAIRASEDEIWVKNAAGVSHIELKPLTVREHSELLFAETTKILDRHGMISERKLIRPSDVSEWDKFNTSDNDGGFTAAFCIGALCRYAVLKREGAAAEELEKARASAVRALEACILMFYISGRDDGFPARSYITTDAPQPKGGLWLKKEGRTAVALDTSLCREYGIVGDVYDTPDEIPARFAKLYRDDGYTDDDIIFKTDTSSDEATLHFINFWYAHKILAEDDPELDSYAVHCAAAMLDHIIKNGYEFRAMHGGSTTWAKWSKRYFAGGLGWGDAPLNASEVLMYCKVVGDMTGDPRWDEEYKKLVADGYADISPLRGDRVWAQSFAEGVDIPEDIMYGDHMLATWSVYGLLMTETDCGLRAKYLKFLHDWRDRDVERQHNPMYDVPYLIINGKCPDPDFKNEEGIAHGLNAWYSRHNVSMLASGTGVFDRYDVPMKIYRAGYRETGFLLNPEERFISKYDRNARQYTHEDSGGTMYVESCTAYTTSYWLGLYHGVLAD